MSRGAEPRGIQGRGTARRLPGPFCRAAVTGLGHQEVVSVGDHGILADAMITRPWWTRPSTRPERSLRTELQRPADDRGVRADLPQAVLLGVDELEDELPRVRASRLLARVCATSSSADTAWRMPRSRSASPTEAERTSADTGTPGASLRRSTALTSTSPSVAR